MFHLTDLLTDIPERQYIAEVAYEDRKRLGQFFTPLEIAHFMVDWVVNNRQQIKILDPAVGLGIFFRAILDRYPDVQMNCIGYDVDEQTIIRAQEIFDQIGQQPIKWLKEDYLYAEWEEGYDGIVCNPPYLRFHDYAQRDQLLEIFNQKQMQLSGLTNIYTLFLLKSIQQLNLNGRMAYIVPSEFLNADYGKLVKKYLKQSGFLRYVIVIDYKTGVFEDALTTSAILLLANDQHSDHVEFLNIHGIEELEEIRTHLKNYPTVCSRGSIFKSTELEESKKWRIYYQPLNRDKYKNLVPFFSYAKISRGIATGANDYFSFSISKQKKYQIPLANLQPCLIKAQDVRGHFFTENHFQRLQESDKPIYLFEGSVNLASKMVQDYLQLGEKLKIHQRYLTRHRNPWYALENRPPAPILVKVFNRAGLNFIRNEAGISNLTAFHCVYIKPEIMPKIDLLMAYLITDVAKEIFSDSRREYAAGLKKFEPNDLNNAYVVDLLKIDQQTTEKILQAYFRFREEELMEKDTTQTKRRLNQIFLQILEMA